MVLSGRYELDARVGAGGFGEVWRATDTILGRPVAAKLLYAGYAQHGEALARFRAEARHAGGLSHENIARVYDYGDPDGSEPPYLIMEFIDGPPLAEVLRRGPLSPLQTARILAQAAAGLAAAHEAGLVHRDVKPGNLLIGPRGVVKITDFGLARTADSAPLTVTGMLVGTPGYLAPERAAGASATPAADLYALGIIGYECLAGNPPFTGTPLEVTRAHCSQPLPELPPSAPADLAALIGHLTARRPADRPASAAAVAQHADQIAAREAAGAAGVAGLAGLASAAATAPGVVVPLSPSLPPAAVRGPAGPVTARLPALPGPRPEQPAGLPRPPLGRRLVLGLAAATLVAAAGLAAASQMVQPPAGHAGTIQSPGTHPAATGAATVTVRAGALIGQPVAAVARELRHRGLIVRVRWQRSAAEPPHTVLGVAPGGPVRAGSTVVVTGALAPPGHARPAQAKPKPKPGKGSGPQPGTDPKPGHGPKPGKGPGHKDQGSGPGPGGAGSQPAQPR